MRSINKKLTFLPLKNDTKKIGPKLGQAFDPRSNALNAWRLTLATGVIVWHSFQLTGRHMTFAPAHQLLSQIFVDGFFAVSGFLITASWLNNPQPRSYFAARALRILPGLWVCLIVTAFVIAPISVAIQKGSPTKLLLSGAPFGYVLKNAAVLTLQLDVAGTPCGVPFPGNWDGSLWTLIWEVLCYVGVAVAGMLGLLRHRWFIPAVLVAALCWSTLLPSWSFFADALESAQHIDPAVFVPLVQAVAARFVIMFAAGALVYQLRNLIPARWALVVLSMLIVLASSLLRDYRLVGAIPLAYAIIASGSLIHSELLRLRTDLSYGVYIYAYPIQQLMVICGIGRLNPYVFAAVATVATLPLAAMSWFVVEKPAMGLKARVRRPSIVSQPAVA